MIDVWVATIVQACQAIMLIREKGVVLRRIPCRVLRMFWPKPVVRDSTKNAFIPKIQGFFCVTGKLKRPFFLSICLIFCGGCLGDRYEQQVPPADFEGASSRSKTTERDDSNDRDAKIFPNAQVDNSNNRSTLPARSYSTLPRRGNATLPKRRSNTIPRRNIKVQRRANTIPRRGQR